MPFSIPDLLATILFICFGIYGFLLSIINLKNELALVVMVAAIGLIVVCLKHIVDYRTCKPCPIK